MKPEKETASHASETPSESATVPNGAGSVAESGPRAGDSGEPLVESTAEAKSGAEPPERSATSARSAAQKRPLLVPALLLEGDEPTEPSVGGPGQRYALGPAPPEQPGPTAELGELPEAYGTRKLLLTARDPHWLYAHWDLTRNQLRDYNQRSADGHLVLRVYIGAVGGDPFVEVHVHPESRNWFVHVGRGATRFVAEIGYYAKPDRHWTGISVSAPALTPPDTPASDTSVQFTSIPIEVPFEQLLVAVKAAVCQNIPLAGAILQPAPGRREGILPGPEHVPLAESILHLRSEGFKGLPGPSQVQAAQCTPAQERALAELISMDSARRVWLGSLEITALMGRKHEISSAAAAPFPLPAGERVSAVGSVSSPFGGVELSKGFWFNINAELILYGATEPDARVTIGGRDIKLRPDGSFSYRFGLPDGQYELAVVVVSPDQTDGRATELKFRRQTEYRGQVGAHPQDPRLQPPLAGNVAP